ncbi:formate dehydrogenase, alpha subunit [Ammonifex degensii KC4]|uniref:Formate dehydrogenase, alpha subunit n=3 Tax=Ammonifex degensii TaxID=42838 RepID=C9RB20_AMMDK|nr:formate dehydrogenase, alpha subunit [Ammonifex degensii KC4]
MTNHFIDYKNSDVVMVIGANPAENHPQAMKWILRGKAERGTKLIVVDPRFTKTAAHADIYAPIRPGTDIAFLLGIINYALEHNLYFHDYVVNYTNASFLVDPNFKFEDGLFSGATTKDGQFVYDPTTWQYQKEGDKIKRDPTLQDPNCVFQILKRFVSRYDIKTVCRITGTPEDVYRQVCELYCSTGRPDKAGNIIYAMGITQHTYGSQNVRAVAILQLLLGNVGIAGGGINAQRGESNVQGSTDMAMLFHLLPGYLSCPDATKHPTLKDYIAKETPKTSFWSNTPKFLISQLKAWFGPKATPENEFCYQWLPKLDGKDHSHMAIFQSMAEGKIKGFFAWGQNPAVGGPAAEATRKAMEKLDWLVVVDLFETETAAFWKRPGADPRKIKTEVFFLPAAFSYEKEGTVTNSGRWIQYRWKAVDPPGDAKSDLWIVDRLFKAVREEYRKGGRFPDPILNMVWDYDAPGSEEPDINKVALEINGYEVDTGKPLPGFAKLTNTGSTACGCWIYAGYWAPDPDLGVVAAKRRDRTDKSGLGLYPKWSFAWPANRRIVYNRCSCDPSGRPWDPARALVYWDGSKWVTNDVPDFGAKDPATGADVPPEKSAQNPFIMVPEGVGRLFGAQYGPRAAALKDGPLPEHYEPIESPVRNLMSKQQNNPVAKIYKGEGATRGEPEKYPYVLTTHRLVEHYQSGAVTRNSPWLTELMPEMFVGISPRLAAKLGIKPGDRVVVLTARGKIYGRASVLPTLQPLKVDGKEVEVVALPWHWGYQGMAPGDSANVVTALFGDPNTFIPEYKALLCDVRKA